MRRLEGWEKRRLRVSRACFCWSGYGAGTSDIFDFSHWDSRGQGAIACVAVRSEKVLAPCKEGHLDIVAHRDSAASSARFGPSYAMLRANSSTVDQALCKGSRGSVINEYEATPTCWPGSEKASHSAVAPRWLGSGSPRDPAIIEPCPPASTCLSKLYLHSARSVRNPVMLRDVTYRVHEFAERGAR